MTGDREADRNAGTSPCAGCGERIDWCEVCDRAGCPAAICFSCTQVASGTLLEQPHSHGG